MRNIFFNLMFLFVMVGCAQPTLNKVQQVVEAQSELLVDCGLIHNKYVVLYELAVNDSNHIYLISDSEFPVESHLESPSKIVPYKDKYLCFIELDEQEMSVADIKEMTGYSGNPMVEIDYTPKWCVVISKFGEKRALVELSSYEDWSSWFDIVELWPYLSGYVEDYPVQMGVLSHDIQLERYPGLSLNADSIKRELFDWNGVRIKSVYGQMYLRNNTTSTVCLSSSTKEHYAVVNGRDSLYLSLCDSLPIVLKPLERKTVEYRSLSGQSGSFFFEHLASEKNPWEYFYNLFCRSTYCLMNVNGEELKTKVMFHDIGNYGFEVTCEKFGKETLFRILNHGIYDKEDRIEKNTKLWWTEWNNRSEADRQKISDAVDEKLSEKRQKINPDKE
ncbi:Imm65 family immunity protein [Bacteroides xylanisolvens]|uniref:Imm65 family immunity protein n=1 Tax=Bacteroides xylanisolvens TaxID=371601 RepID=UPI0018986B12|nr:Imm65 family immunity protein [Bacteroides xylanisolvens]